MRAAVRRRVADKARRLHHPDAFPGLVAEDLGNELLDLPVAHQHAAKLAAPGFGSTYHWPPISLTMARRSGRTVTAVRSASAGFAESIPPSSVER